MSLKKRGKYWHYDFKFAGLEIRESTKSKSKTLAKDAEDARRRELERGYNRVKKPKRPLLVSVAADEWLHTKSEKAEKTKIGYESRLFYVKQRLGRRLVTDIGPDDILEYRRARLADRVSDKSNRTVSNRTVNYEIGCIRGILKRAGLWAEIVQELPGLKLRENDEVGRALSPEDDRKLLAAVKASKAPSLFPLYTIAIETGLRSAEIKALRRKDLSLEWKNGCIVSGEIVVPRSKTEAGRLRSVPLSTAACSVLTMWLSRFPKATAESFVFPRHKIAMIKGGQAVLIRDVRLDKPVQSWATAWRTALKQAKVHYRWHDLRHTFVTHLCENPLNSEQTIMTLAGHVSKKMLDTYSHIRVKAKQDAIRALDIARSESLTEGAQKGAQNAESEKTQ
jgi:integrase